MKARLIPGIAFVSIVVGSAFAQTPTYDLVFLGSPPVGTSGFPSAVNDFGVVVGGDGSAKAWVASPTSAAVALPLPAGYTTAYAHAINDAGVIAGATLNATTLRAVLWTPSPGGYVVTLLPPTAQGVVPRRAWGLNELGDVVGELGPNSGFHWTAAQGTVDLSLAYGVIDPARGINELRQVVLRSKRVDLDTGAVADAGFAFFPGFFIQINDAGVGLTYTPNAFPFSLGHGGIHDFFTSTWTLYGSGPLGGSSPGIDHATNVVYMSNQPMLHRDGVGEFALASLLDPAFAQWTLTIAPNAGAMSANGLIATFGTSPTGSGTVLLVPKYFKPIVLGAEGLRGLPALIAGGVPTAPNVVTLRMSRTSSNAPAALILSTIRTDQPFFGGTLVPQPDVVLTGLMTDANGNVALAAPWPAGIASGTTIYMQAWIADPAAAGGVAGSNAIECVVP